MRLKFLLILIIGIHANISAFAEKILVFGKTFTKSELLKENLIKEGFELEYINVSDVNKININNSRLLLISADELLPNEIRLPIHNFLKSGGNIIIVGANGFDYAPIPTNPISVTSLINDYNIIWPKRKIATTSVEKPEIKSISFNGKIALQLSTKNKAMPNVMVQFSVKNKVSESRTVLSFKAKGSHFMDLLALEIVDTKGKKWYNFVPLSITWQTFNVSLADFIPESWSHSDKPYNLLNPTTIDSIAIGTNMMTLWKEKAMNFCISDITLAENVKNIYAPTSSLKKLALPYKENNIAFPEWIFDPFYQAVPVKNISINSNTHLFKNIGLNIQEAWYLPPAFSAHPGTKMGTDTKLNYDGKIEREMRTDALFTADNKENVAELRQFGGGKYYKASLGLYGLNPVEIITDEQFIKSVTDVAKYMLFTPRILTVNINTTVKKDGQAVHPLLKVEVYNPSNKSIEDGNIQGTVNNFLKKDVKLSIKAKSSEVITIVLPTVPANFPFKKFNWEVKLSTKNGVDFMRDSVDVERSMVTAFKYLIKAQKFYPDGRYSNHYFGDAYGVRAMFAYLDYLDKNPDRLKLNKDVRNSVNKDDIKNSAAWFYNMLVERQTDDGAYPMGYSEHTQGYNVADGGQIGLSMAQSLRYIKDPAKKQSYLNSVIKFGNWAESFYIDAALSQQLKISHPKEYNKGEAQPGFYGLGQSRYSKRRTGPSWVLSDVIAAQIALSHLASDTVKSKFKDIAERNSVFYANKQYPATGYYQAEALFWIFLNTQDTFIKNKIRENLTETFLAPLLKGKEYDMYTLGSRSTLKALPLLYYKKYIADNEGVRAVLLKYIWSFGSESSTHSMKGLSEIFPKAVHGESLTVAKYAALSSLWAIELLYPESTLIKFQGK